jgi:DNA (cytosine-5)-methyltransferase 1
LGAVEAARSRGKAAEIVLAVDKDADALAVYERNLLAANSKARNGDLASLFALPGRTFTAAEKALRTEIGRLDILVAGPPCQGHSDLNNQTRRQDPRNQLYSCVVRAVEVFRPTAILIENVPSVVHDRGNVVSESVKNLERWGYHVSSCVVDTADIGLAQRRRRHVLVASSRREFDATKALAAHSILSAVPISKYLSDILEEADESMEVFYSSSKMQPQNEKRVRWLFEHDEFNLPNRLRPSCHQNGHSYMSMYGRMQWDKPAQTITGGFGCMGQGRFVHPKRPRTLTPHEAARIQGFPDFFVFDDVKKRAALQQIIGNAVPPKLAAVFVQGLLDQGCV